MATADLLQELRFEDQEDPLKSLKPVAFFGPPPATLLPAAAQRASSSCGGQKQKLTNRKMFDQMATSQREHEDDLQQHCKVTIEMLNRQDNIMSSCPAQQKRNQETETHQRHEDKQRVDQTERVSQLNKQTGSEQQGREGQKNKETSIMASAVLQQDLMLEDPEDTETSIMASAVLQQEQMLEDQEDTETSIMATADLLLELMLEDPEDTETSIMATADLLLELMLEDPEDTETSIMASADLQQELMFSWIKQRELCAEQLKKLAQELESLREKRNLSKRLGSAAAVFGASCLFWAGVVFYFIGVAAAAVAVFVVGAAHFVGGVAILVVTKIIKRFLSSSTMKELQQIEKNNNKVSDKIQKLFQQLKNRSPSADPDEVDRHIVTEILRAMGRRSGLKGEINVRVRDNKPQFYLGAGPRHMVFNQIFFVPEVMVRLSGILTFFTFELSGKEFKLLFAEGAEQLKQVATAGLQTALRGGAMAVGGALGLGFALPEAIKNWTDLIKENHVNEASQSLTDTAEDLLKISRTLREQFDNIKNMFDQMATSQQEHEENLQTHSKENPEMLNKENIRYSYISYSAANEQTRSTQQGLSNQHPRGTSFLDNYGNRPYYTNLDRIMYNNTLNVNANQRPPRAIRVGLLNVQSLVNKELRILNLITQNSLDVFLTTETFLTINNAFDILSLASPDNFVFQYHVRMLQRRGGVAIQFSRNLHAYACRFDFITTFEYVATVLQHVEWTEPILIVNVYQPNGQQLVRDRFNAFMNQLAMLFSLPFNRIIVTGDFNIHVDVDSARTNHFLGILDRFHLVQHVQEPTYIDIRNARRRHTLDLVITRNVNIFDLHVQDDQIADHCTVYFTAGP